MAKKVVATLQKGGNKNFVKAIKMEKSPKSGSYVFKEEILPSEEVKNFFSK